MFDYGERNLRVFLFAVLFFVSTHLTCILIAPLHYTYSHSHTAMRVFEGGTPVIFLHAFSTKCRVFINISGLPRIEPAALIRLTTTDQRRNLQRYPQKDGRDAANELRGQP